MKNELAIKGESGGRREIEGGRSEGGEEEMWRKRMGEEKELVN